MILNKKNSANHNGLKWLRDLQHQREQQILLENL